MFLKSMRWLTTRDKIRSTVDLGFLGAFEWPDARTEHPERDSIIHKLFRANSYRSEDLNGSKHRVTALVGSGLTIPIGGPTTGLLTEHVCQSNVLCGRLRDILDSFLDPLNRFETVNGPVRSNFEDICDLLETLLSWTGADRPDWAPEYKPRERALITLDPSLMSAEDLIAGLHQLIEVIGNDVAMSTQNFQPRAAHRWFADFWAEAVTRADWDVATLNYDSILEELFGPGKCEDGFRTTGQGYGRFDPMLMYRPSAVRILHLHGSILYGHPFDALERYHLVDDFHDLYKFDAYDQARQSWLGHSFSTTQAHRTAIIGGLITGLHKTDKLNVHPYDEYQAMLRDAVRSSPRLLVVGCSFSDLYVNSILQQLFRLHGKNRRVAVVLQFPSGKTEWHYDPGVVPWMSHEMLEMLGYLSQDVRPLGSSLIFHSPLQSADGRSRIYLEGTEDALGPHGSSLLDFLCS